MAWMVGPALSSIMFNILTHRISVVPQKAYQVATLIIAASIGLSFSPGSLYLIAEHAALVASIIGVTIILSVAVGFLIVRWTGTDATTALISSIPAGASGMVVMSRELGADERFVAAIQYLRLMTVVTLIPFVAARLSPRNAVEPAATNQPEMLLPIQGAELAGIPETILMLLVSIMGAVIAKRFHIAASGFIGPLAAMVIARLAGLPLVGISPVILDAALLTVGATIGSQIDLRTLILIGRAVLISAGLMIGMIVSCGILGYVLHLITEIDQMTAILATTPGGMEVVTVTALELGANTSLVTAIQLVRLFSMLLIIPLLIGWSKKN